MRNREVFRKLEIQNSKLPWFPPGDAEAVEVEVEAEIPEEGDGDGQEGQDGDGDADAAAAKKLEEQMAALQQDLEAEARWFHGMVENMGKT